MHIRRFVLTLVLVLIATTAFAQQTGSISGRVTATDGSALPRGGGGDDRGARCRSTPHLCWERRLWIDQSRCCDRRCA